MPTPILEPLVSAALEAGADILCVYTEGCAVDIKPDGSPVTIADQRAEAIILAALARDFPGVPVVAEEEACAGRIPADLGTRFFLVDPLDGTRGFADRTGEFTVNIALIENGDPVAGVVYAPVPDALYFGEIGHGASRRLKGGAEEAIATRSRLPGRLDAVGSRNHASPEDAARLAEMGVTGHVASGSSLKFCVLAEGGADVYPRWGRTMEWDTAAGHAVLEAAGGRVLDLAGDPLRYGKPGFENPHFIAWGT
ncbi:3'(2'),5'-bisphosphate nucleotidase CysQ [Allosphingosinicella indica]|uniref:3'(2'),5'-bisphosphate nucleotidase CysQ n=1 Tax=Allosphingosinicella indica TaxID=941907 RepID=A0A1X7G0J6_9SPHN|nr:3'(2'),5'-bisphosphate nucleotidase CysQ [Allosphingosinicella indica]SMF61393.1 3'(2'),5'-bisphosphate nucleotidase [Allosphingosinicella indica]